MRKDRVVKIDADIARKVEEAVKENKIKYSSIKQFIDMAVLEKLGREITSNIKPKMLHEEKREEKEERRERRLGLI